MNIPELVSKLIELRTNEYSPKLASPFTKSLPDDSAIIAEILELKNNNDGGQYLTNLKRECQRIMKIRMRMDNEIISEFHKKNPDYKDCYDIPFPSPNPQNGKYYLGEKEITVFEYYILQGYHLHLITKQSADKNKTDLKPHLEHCQHSQLVEIPYYKDLQKENDGYDEQIEHAFHDYEDTLHIYHRIANLAQNILKYLDDLKEDSSVCDDLRIKAITIFFEEIGVAHSENDWRAFLNLRAPEKYKTCPNRPLIAYCCEEFKKEKIIAVTDDWFEQILEQLKTTKENYKSNKHRVAVKYEKTVKGFIKNQQK